MPPHKARRSRAQQLAAKREGKRHTSQTIARFDEKDLPELQKTPTSPKQPISASRVRRKRKKSTTKRTRTVSRGPTFDIAVSQVTSMRGRIHPSAQQPFDQPSSTQNEFVDSTAIESYRYSTSSKILEIIFVSGGSKRYLGVPLRVIRGLGVASSKGRYFHRMIYGTWSGKKGKMKYTPRYREV